MKYLVTLLLLAISKSAFSYDCGSSPFISTQKDNGEKIGLFASKKDFEGAEKWLIENGEPPLSISEAVLLASEWANRKYTRFDSIKINSITLQEASCSKLKGHWLYVLDLSPVIDGNKLYGSGYMVAITMSQNILEPRAFSE